MSVWGEILVGVVIAISLASVVIPVLPGLLVEAAAIGVWAWFTGGALAWSVFAICTVILVVGTIVKFTKPGGTMRRAGVPGSTLWIGLALAIVGLFVIPIVGLFVGFVVGVYLAELRRVGQRDAWPSTKLALRAVVHSIAIEFLAGLAAAGVWIVGAVVA